MKMSRSEYLERKQRIEDGEGSDDDRRLVDLYAEHFESDGDDGLDQIDVHTSKQQTEDSQEAAPVKKAARSRANR